MGGLAAILIGGCQPTKVEVPPGKPKIELVKPAECERIESMGLTSFGRKRQLAYPYIVCANEDGSHMVYEFRHSGWEAMYSIE